MKIVEILKIENFSGCCFIIINSLIELQTYRTQDQKEKVIGTVNVKEKSKIENFSGCSYIIFNSLIELQSYRTKNQKEIDIERLKIYKKKENWHKIIRIPPYQVLLWPLSPINKKENNIEAVKIAEKYKMDIQF